MTAADDPHHRDVRDVRGLGEGAVFSQIVHPDHHQYWLVADRTEPNLDTLYDNGAGDDPLVAVDDSGRMACIFTGIYGFDLPLTVQVHPRRPEPDLDPWQEVVEFSLLADGDRMTVVSILADDGHLDIPLPTPPGTGTGTGSSEPKTSCYRVRLHANGRRHGTEVEHVSLEDGDDLVEQHLLQVWPAPAQPDQWIKQLP
ncbi:hypothetical protein ACIBF1_44310 [Spirillospora sp. NPDC050679]